jgi:hypothetical protein
MQEYCRLQSYLKWASYKFSIFELLRLPKTIVSFIFAAKIDFTLNLLLTK